MFRKPKRKLKDTLRKKDEEEVGPFTNYGQQNSIADEDNEEDTTETETTLEIARSKRDKGTLIASKGSAMSTSTNVQTKSVMHTYDVGNDSIVNKRDLVTSTAEHHPTKAMNADNQDLLAREDGIYRGDQVRNKFHAGPIRAASHVRVTARFDYQPDICKDYKETGFCGYGDTCIYLHDRTDTISGWQLERQWEEQQKLKKVKQEQIMNDFATGILNDNRNDDSKLIVSDDGLPFACHICREHFKDPVVTNCSHYFCEACIMNHVRTVSEACPICNKDTGSVFNLPTKLIAKKRKILGSDNSNDEDSWIKYFRSFRDEKNS
jgi:RING finger protein 113A